MIKKISDGIRKKTQDFISPLKSDTEFSDESKKQHEDVDTPRPSFFDTQKKEDDGRIFSESERMHLHQVAGASEDAILTGGPEYEKYRDVSNRYIWWGSGIGFILLCVVISLSTVFARLTITIMPQTEKLDFEDIFISLDTAASRVLPSQKTVPAELLEFSRTDAQEFEATGRRMVEEKSKGRVRIYNSFSSSSQRLVAQTRFVTDGGLLFRLSVAVTIPGAKIEEGKIVPEFFEAELVADASGEGSNIDGEVNLKIPGFQGTPKYAAFYAVALSGFHGGFKGEAQVVSAEDLKKAQEQVTKSVFEELKSEITQKIPPGFTLSEGLREILITSIKAPELNSRLDRFSVEASAAGRAFVFREEALAELLEALLVKESEKKSFISGSQKFSYRPTNVNFDKGRADIAVNGNLKIKAEFSQEEIPKEVVGKKEGSIIEILKNHSEFASFRLSFFPSWRSSAPPDPTKIRIVVQEPE